MNTRKLISLTLTAILCILLTAGCGSETPDEVEAPAVENTSASPVVTSGQLLKNVSLTLPDEITREDVSDTRAVFRYGGNIIGGIEILNIAGQRDTLPFSDDYRDLTADVTKLVHDGNYDYTLEKATPMSDLEVQIKFWDDHQCFVHYFFFGETVVYDIWADSDILDGQDMISILKTLHSDDIINPQDTAPVNDDMPILNLRIDRPKELTRVPASGTRVLFYSVPMEQVVSGQNVVGGVEAVVDATDFPTIEAQLAALGQRYIGGEFETDAATYSDANVLAKITAASPDAQLTAYVIRVETDTYAVWGTAEVVPEDTLLEIAKSCKY